MAIHIGRSDGGGHPNVSGGPAARDDDQGDHHVDDDDRRAFLESVRGVRRLGGARAGRVLADPAGGSPGALPAAGRPSGTARPGGVRLVVERGASSWTARADGVAQRVIRRLRDGTIAVDGEADLHGLTRAEASQALDTLLTRAQAAGQRCLLVIHGRGLHSGPDGPALGDLVRERLTQGPFTHLVLACASAPPARGGNGATVLYLRR